MTAISKTHRVSTALLIAFALALGPDARSLAAQDKPNDALPSDLPQAPQASQARRPEDRARTAIGGIKSAIVEIERDFLGETAFKVRFYTPEDATDTGVALIAEALKPVNMPVAVSLQSFKWTPKLDGEATGCNPVEVGSIPTGVSAQLTPRTRCSRRTLDAWRRAEVDRKINQNMVRRRNNSYLTRMHARGTPLNLLVLSTLTRVLPHP